MRKQITMAIKVVRNNKWMTSNTSLTMIHNSKSRTINQSNRTIEKYSIHTNNSDELDLDNAIKNITYKPKVDHKEDFCAIFRQDSETIKVQLQKRLESIKNIKPALKSIPVSESIYMFLEN